MPTITESMDFIRQFKTDCPAASKTKIQAAWIDWASPRKLGSVFVLDDHSIRFSQAKSDSFSSTVLSLSALSKHDSNPFVVSVVRPRAVDFLLANSTFLSKVSHSSQLLRVENVRGSFNGTDIIRIYDGIVNEPRNFDELFALHNVFTWQENLERLVRSTNGIAAHKSRFEPTAEQIAHILSAPERFASLIDTPEFVKAEQDISARMIAMKHEILIAAKSDNVNIRGNTIEQLITDGKNTHDLGDMAMQVGVVELVIDVKTKLLDRTSAPKAYNVDKFLRLLAQPGHAFAFFIIGIDVVRGEVSGRLICVLDDVVRDSSKVQHHWTGRDSRGVTQLSGNFIEVLAPSYRSEIDIAKARSFLKALIDI